MVDGLSAKHVYDEVFSLLRDISTDLDIQKVDFNNLKENIKSNREVVISKLKEIDDDLDSFKQGLTEFVDSIEGPYLERSRKSYLEGLQHDTPDYILDRHNFKKLLYKEDTRDFFLSRVKLHANWKWPAMEIRPAWGEITDSMIAGDPLYIVDTDEELFKHVKKKWTPEYQRRLRYYAINETQHKFFAKLPQGQIGLIIAVDFFNFKPLDVIDRYLREMYAVMRPGGTAIFTYNNCDLPIAVENFENSYYAYTPGRTVKDMCEKIGFKVTASFDLENNVSWIEIERPGRRTSLRGGQTLAKIMNIDSGIT